MSLNAHNSSNDFVLVSQESEFGYLAYFTKSEAIWTVYPVVAHSFTYWELRNTKPDQVCVYMGLLKKKVVEPTGWNCRQS